MKRWKERSIQRRLEPEDLQITDSRYGMTLGLLQCLECGFIFAEADELTELGRLYEALDDQAYEAGIENRSRQMRWLVDIGKAANPAARSLLDIGAGIGLLVKEAQSSGLAAEGVELSRSLVEAGSRLLGINLVQGTFPHRSLSGRTFDLIYVVDVIEHVSDPIQLLLECRKALAPNGVLVVVTPDIRSLAARTLRHRWWHLRLAHVGYFDASTMAKGAEAAGLTVAAKRRALWFFPVGYVAARLERYLPVSALNRALLKTSVGRSLFGKVIGLNLLDSWVFVFRRR